jgi:ketosteroid isomerase-like protein
MEPSSSPSELATEEPSGSSTVADFVERFAAAWRNSDLERLMALLADEVVLKQPMLPTTVGKAAGREAFAKLFEAFPGLTATVHNWGAEGNIVFIEFTLSCTFGGRELSWPAVDRFVLRDGLVAERVNYFDALPLFFRILARPRGWASLARARMRPSLR